MDGHLIAEHCGATSVGAENNRKATREGGTVALADDVVCVCQVVEPSPSGPPAAGAVVLSCRDVPCRPGWWPPLTTPAAGLAVVVARGFGETTAAPSCRVHCYEASFRGHQCKHISPVYECTYCSPFVHRPSSLAPISNKSACIQDDDETTTTEQNPNGLIPLRPRRSFRHHMIRRLLAE
jgi:hypothetical protein